MEQSSNLDVVLATNQRLCPGSTVHGHVSLRTAKTELVESLKLHVLGEEKTNFRTVETYITGISGPSIRIHAFRLYDGSDRLRFLSPAQLPYARFAVPIRGKTQGLRGDGLRRADANTTG